MPEVFLQLIAYQGRMQTHGESYETIPKACKHAGPAFRYLE